MLSRRFIRHICTSRPLAFRFKLTEEMSKEYEEKQKSIVKPEPELAVTTKENSLLMGRISSERFKNVVKVGVPKHRFNDFYVLYIREKDDVQAYDEGNITKPGDWVLLRREKEPLDQDVPFTIERVVYQYGNYVDPLTGRRSLGIYFDDEMEKLEQIKLDL